MPQFSSSPLGLTLYSESTETPVIGSYVISGSSSVASIFFNQTNQSFNFNPSVGNNTTYNTDISTIGLINYTSTIPAMTLRNADFAYLKNLGVYPNNRLMIARRFPSPVNDDLTAHNLHMVPMATLISWVPDNEDFISVDFGENWTDGESSFRDILNELGKDVLVGDNKSKLLGDAASSGFDGIPLPGFMESLQYNLFKQLGMTDIDASNLPLGNPNLIRESKRRKTLSKEQPGAGLNCKIKIKMVVEYEQKFINGIDPTIVYYDIIANALSFGTSQAQFQFRGNVSNSFNAFLNNIGSGDNSRILHALTQFITAIGFSLNKVGDQILSIFQNSSGSNPQSTSNPSPASNNGNNTSSAINSALSLGSGAINQALKILPTIVQGLVSKYKLRIMSVVNALTGTPSAPWHITIGNPRRPILSTGDMVMEEVTITMGKALAFNDLPSYIKLEFKLESARNIGAQEIFKKFNCGKERTYKKLRLSFVETDKTQPSSQLSSTQVPTPATQNLGSQASPISPPTQGSPGYLSSQNTSGVAPSIIPGKSGF